MINETQAKEFALGIEDPAIPDMQKFKMATALDEYFKAEDLKIDKGVKKAFTTDTVEGVEINDDIMAGFGAAPEDIANIKKGAANTAWIARQEKKPVDYFSLTLPAYQDAYAQQVFKLPKKNVTNDEFYNLVRENYKAQDNAHNFAFGAAARDLTADSAMREFDVGLTGSPVAGRIDDYHQSIQDLHMEYTQKLAPYRTIIDQAAKTIEGYDTKAEGAYTAFEKVAESLLPLPPKERLLAINAIGEIGAAAPKEKRVYLEKIMLAMDREIEKAVTGTSNMAESLAYSGLEMGLSAMNLPGLAKATSEMATKRRDLQVLAGQIRMMAQNKINPIEGNNWWEDTGIGIARMAPLMTATFINGPASIAIMTGQFRDEATIEAVNAGASLENSEIVAFVAAPIMAGQEFLSNALPLGKIKIPFIDKWLKASTTSIKSAAIRLAIRGSLNTGTEITEEIMQTVTPLVTQDLLSEWQTEWSIESGIAKADWDERMPKISDIAKETFGPALVISFLMAGRISIADVKNSRALMTSPDYMVASGISPDLANQITAEGLKGNYNEVDKLFRQGFDKANKATPEQIKEAEEKVNTQASNSLEYYNKLKKEFGLGTVSNLGNGKYQFTTPILKGSKGEVVDSGVSAQFNSISEANEAQMLYVKNRQASIRKAEQEFITSMNISLQEKQGLDIALMDFDMFTKTFTELFPSTASQVDERIKLTDQIDGAAEDVSFEDATLESEVKDNKNYRILGTNSIEQREGISTGVITLYSGGSLLDLIEESAEVGVKRLMNDPMSRTKLILQIRDVEAKMEAQAMQMGQKHMPLIATADDDQVSNMEIIEAFSHIAKSYYVQTAKAVERPTFTSDMPLNLYLGSLQSSIAGMELKDAIDLVGEKTLNILYRASQIKAVYDANGMNQDFIDALEKSVGLNVSNRNADAVVDTATGIAADAGVSMSMGRAQPADTSNITEMPDGAQLVGPTTFSITAYHGTPYQVDRFRMAKIGTGEGAQAFGWGLYFAKARKVAEDYRRKLSAENPNAAGERVRTLWDDPFYSDTSNGWISGNGNLLDYNSAEALALDVFAGKKSIQDIEEDMVSEVNAILDSGDLKEIIGLGNLYTVELLPDEEDFLDWDKPLSEQSEKVRVAFRGYDINLEGKQAYDRMKASAGMRAEWDGKRWNIFNVEGQNIGAEVDVSFAEGPQKAIEVFVSYGDNAADNQTASKTTSERLASLGIPGIRYLDGSSRAAGEGTSNYVIFDESLVKILEENGQRVDVSQTSESGPLSFSLGRYTKESANDLADKLGISSTIDREYLNRVILPIMADLMAGGTGVGVPWEGGPIHPLLHYGTDVAWRSARGAIAGILGYLDKRGGVWKDTDGHEWALVAVFAMSQDAHQSNNNMFMSFMNAVEASNPTDAQKLALAKMMKAAGQNALNEAIKKYNEKTLPNWEEKKVKLKAKYLEKVETRSAVEAVRREAADQAGKKYKPLRPLDKYEEPKKPEEPTENRLMNFPEQWTAQEMEDYVKTLIYPERAEVMNRLKKQDGIALGLPDVETAIRQGRDDSYDMITGGSMLNVIKVDVTRLRAGLRDDTLNASDFGVPEHLSYDTVLPGEIVTHLRQPVPMNVAFPDMVREMKQASPDSSPTYLMQAKLPESVKLQKLTPKVFNAINDVQKLSIPRNRALMMISALDNKWEVAQKGKSKNIASYMRAVKNSVATSNLVSMTEPEIKAALKNNTLKIYKLPGFAIFFAIKKNADGTMEMFNAISNELALKGAMDVMMHKALSEGANMVKITNVITDKKPLGVLASLFGNHGWKVESKSKGSSEISETQEAEWTSIGWDKARHPKPMDLVMRYEGLDTNQISASPERLGKEDAGSIFDRTNPEIETESTQASQSDVEYQPDGTDGAGASGNVGGYRGSIPRGGDSIVAELAGASKARLEALGLTAKERDEILKKVGANPLQEGTTFSISRSDFTGRIEQSLRPIFEGSPEAKLKIGVMALKRAQKIAADSLYDVGRPGAAKRKLAEMEASRIKKLAKVTDKTPDWVKKSLEKETTPEQAKAALMKDKLNGWIQMHDAIISSMPTEIRGTIGSISTLAKLSSDEARLRFIEDRMPKVEKAIEKYLKKGYGERIEKMLEAAAVKGKAGEIPKSKFIVTVQDELNTIIAMSNLSDEETVKEAARYEAEIISAQTSEDAADAFAKSQLLEIFGDLYGKQTTAEEMDVAHEYLKDLMKQGRDARKVLDEARAAEVAKMVEQAKADAFAGDANAATVQRGKDKGKGTTKGMMKGMLRELGSHRFLLSSLFGKSNKTADHFDERMILGVNAFETRQAARKKGLRDFMRTLYGTKSKIRLDIELEKMETRVQRSGVTKLEGEVREKDTKTVEEVERIIKSPSTFGYSAEEARMWEDEMDAWSNLPTSRKRNLTIERVKVKGTRIEIPLSQMEAVYMAMALRQPGILDQQTVHGYDNITQAELEDFMSDKAKNWLAWFGAEYANEYDAANEVFMKLFNTRMPQIQFYAPLLKNHQGNQASLDPLNSGVVSQSVNPGAVKSRRGRTSSLRIESALAVYQSHFAQMDYWINMAEYLRDTQAVMLNPDVQNAIKSEHGSEALQALSSWMQLEMSRGVGKGALIMHASKMMRNVKSGIALKALAFNIGTSIKTLSSIFYSLGEISIPNWPAAFARGIQHWGRMWDTDSIQNRLELGGTPEIRDILANPGRSKNIILRLVENALLYGSMPTQYADAVLTSYSAAMVYGDRLAQAEKAGAGDEAAHKYAAREMAIVVKRTSQPSEWSGRSLMQNDATGVFNLLSMFSSDPQQKLSLVGEAIMKRKRGGASNEETIRKVLAYWVIPGLMFQVANAVTRSMFKDDDEEWEVDNFIRAALVGPLQGFFLLGSAAEFFISSAVAYAAEKITGEEQDKPRNWRSSTNPLVDISDQFIESIKKLPEKMEDEDYLGGAWEIMKAGGALATPLSPAGAAPGVADRVFKDTTTLFYGDEED